MCLIVLTTVNSNLNLNFLLKKCTCRMPIHSIKSIQKITELHFLKLYY